MDISQSQEGQLLDNPEDPELRGWGLRIRQWQWGWAGRDTESDMGGWGNQVRGGEWEVCSEDN